MIPAVYGVIKRRALRRSWSKHEEDDRIQIVVYSTEHLTTLGRVEKRTLYYNDALSFFGNNEVILNKVMTAACQATAELPFVPRFIAQEDRWHIMNICMNRISALFGPFHIFFNEARRCKSYYKSAWYLYTITSQQNMHHGRFFVTPYKPVMASVDVGVRRLRIELVNEQEMRDICAGSIQPPDWGFFNSRHRHRWETMVKMGEMFEHQLVILESADLSAGEEEDEDESGASPCDASDVSPKSPSSWQSVQKPGNEDEMARTWSPKKHEAAGLNAGALARQASRCGRRSDKHRVSEMDNCIMRVHIPFPTSLVDNAECETSSRDVVLFE